MRKRVPAAVLAVLLAWSMAAPALAAALLSDEYTSTGTFWQAVAEKWYFLPGSLIPSVIGWVCDDVCSESADHKHHGSLKTYEQNPDKSFTAVCSYCSAEFPVYDADLSAAYDDYVAELPASVYGSDGSVYVVPTLFRIKHVDASSILCDLPDGGICEGDVMSVSVNLPLIKVDTTKRYYHSKGGCSYSVEVQYPISFLCSAELFFSSAVYSTNTESGELIYSGQAKNCQAGSTFSAIFRTPNFSIIRDGDYVLVGNYILFSLSDLRLKLTPYATLGDAIYNITTRPTSITGGNYGIIGDNGQITQVTDNSTIVNETNNTYYNPATGETVPITDWSYDYSDRSYTVTTESGDTYTVTYGDENIVIQEGDVIYNIYYIVDGSGTGTGMGPDTHTHDWLETSRTDPGCTTPGQALFTCSQCGETRRETLKATGHTWQVERIVQTAYDDEGSLIQQGYTIYQCAVCGEQYKDIEGTGPPGSNSGGGNSGEEKETLWDKIGNLIGSVFEGLIGMVEAVLGKILDGLNSLAGMLMEKLTAVVETVLTLMDEVPKLFGGFLDFLAAIFPFLPPEITLLLTFGVAAVVFVGIIKAIRR